MERKFIFVFALFSAQNSGVVAGEKMEYIQYTYTYFTAHFKRQNLQVPDM